MKELVDKILCFCELEPREQSELISQVEEYPELAPLLAESRAFSALLDRLKEFERLGDDAVAYLVISRYLSTHPAPGALREFLLRTEKALVQDQSLLELRDKFERRLQEIEASSDAVSEFERLSGHSVDTMESRSAARRHRDRPPVRRVSPAVRLVSPAVRWAAVALILVGSAVFLWSRGSELERAAQFDVSRMTIPDRRLRGGVTSFATVDSLYAHGLSVLARSQHTKLGLFPGYDMQRVGEAEQIMQDVLSKVESDSYLFLEATFYLGKIHLIENKLDRARADFETVVRGGGSKSDEARRILKLLSAH